MHVSSICMDEVPSTEYLKGMPGMHAAYAGCTLEHENDS